MPCTPIDCAMPCASIDCTMPFAPIDCAMLCAPIDCAMPCAVIEVISHVHSPNFLRDFYWRLDARLHHFLVKPGGDYKHLLERAEDRAILELLQARASTVDAAMLLAALSDRGLIVENQRRARASSRPG